MASELLLKLQADARRLEELYNAHNKPGSYEQRNEYLRQLGEVDKQINEELQREKQNISPNTKNQLGISQDVINPLLLLGGLVAAVIILK